ncbi:PilZ domain-containing protein [Altererythrobacter xiamenensis]|uniref:PilZ domain-containing protein n=1 Tax=Altererythrobacter xiamenensis TaxID=1316679 RepID=UPI000A3C62C5
MELRQGDRFASRFVTAARIPASNAEVAILDISTTGCKIRTSSELAQIGATILIRLPDGEEAAGQIAWKNKERCGVKFSKPIPEQLIDRIAL